MDIAAKIKEWVANFKVWVTAIAAVALEKLVGIVDLLKGLANIAS